MDNFWRVGISNYAIIRLYNCALQRPGRMLLLMGRLS
jgi:hypothetical protein